MSAGIQRNDTQQYCSLEESAAKTLSNTSYVQFSPPSSSDWWTIKSVGSPKDSWSSDSDSSQQTIIYGNGNEANIENIQSSDCTLNLSSTTEDMVGKKKKKSKDSTVNNKPSQVVQRRNARERKRVEAVNNAFQKLRKVVPIEENKSKRMSKVKTLQLAIEYINQLQNLLQFTTQHTSEEDLDKDRLLLQRNMLLDRMKQKSKKKKEGPSPSSMQEVIEFLKNNPTVRETLPEITKLNDADVLADLFSDFQQQQQQHVKLEPEFHLRISSYTFD